MAVVFGSAKVEEDFYFGVQSFGFDVISSEAAQLVEGVSVYQMIGSTAILDSEGVLSILTGTISREYLSLF
jgi:hypothetical protein